MKSMDSEVKVVACLDIRCDRVVKGAAFGELIDLGDPVALARRCECTGADELVMLNVPQNKEKNAPDPAVVENLTKAVRIPLTVGGGIRTLEDVDGLLAAGAERVILGTSAVWREGLVEEAVRRFGAEAVAVGIDALDNQKMPSHREVITHSGQIRTNLDAAEFAMRMEEAGVGRLFVTSITCDGERHGYDLALCRVLTLATSLPVTLNGGAGVLAHFLEAVKEGYATSVAAASVFLFQTLTPNQVKMYLAMHGVPLARLPGLPV